MSHTGKLFVLAEMEYPLDEGPSEQVEMVARVLHDGAKGAGIHTLHVAIDGTADQIHAVLISEPHS